MFNYDRNKKMTPRPDHEPKFDPSNKTDRRIVLLVLISLFVVAILITGLVLIYQFNLWAA
ncbi:MAG: hypothetical protein EOM77_01380 [Bacteroidia bacterium]|nr:hypothetical protein [Bacteroidia bacterium]